MPSLKAVFFAIAIAFIASTQAHMIMSSPPPYGNPDKSPLEATGSNFPCKSTTNSGPTTNMAVGSQQILSFNGTAVHGGGSCQVSLTTDSPATKNSKWQVIHSIEGGCPAKNQPGNLPDPQGGSSPDKTPDPDTYKYIIPQGVAPGKYTLAWTWFNKVGNREMYMNCANIQVTGGSSKRDVELNETEYAVPELSERATPSLPAMFVANIPVSDCTTPDGHDVKFPDPGSSVETAAASPLFAPPTGPKCGATGTSASTGPSSGSLGSSSSSSGGSGAAPSAAASSSGSSSGALGAVPSAAAGSSGSSSGSGIAAAAAAPDSQIDPPAGGASAAAPSASNGVASAGAASVPIAPAAVPSSAPAPAANASSGSSASASGSDTGTCTQPGQSICSPDGKQIGTCTASMTVTWIPVAAGTKCSGGYMVAAKRSAKFSNGYIHRAKALSRW
ncbi:hypothetical protein MMC21_006813 [Puttea exsequens]|nr:hypothetical protein [Puttea exsequens]